MKIIKVEPKGFGSNAYILTADGKTAVVIDPAESSVITELASRNLECKYVLLTHGHFDHVGGCGKFYENGVPILCGEKEDKFIFSAKNIEIFEGEEIPEFKISRTLTDGEEFRFGGIKFKVIQTAGHTEGGVCYVAEHNIFTGDTLLNMSIGRCDLPTGNRKVLKESVKKLLELKGDYKVFCGHGENTTLAFERENNPYLK